MNYSRKIVDADAVNQATQERQQRFQQLLDRVTAYQQDSKRDSRLSSGLCRYCYYIATSRIGGAAITTQPCGICERECTYGSTLTDNLCPECAQKHQLCRRCNSRWD